MLAFLAPSSIETRKNWEIAALTTHQADPFCCASDWQLSFHEAFSPKRRLLFAESSGSIALFAESIFSENQVFLTPVEAHWFFGSPLLGENAAELLHESLGFLEKTYAPAFPVFILGGIRPDSSDMARLKRIFGREFNFMINDFNVQCAASLDGGIDGYLSRRSAHHRRKLKQAARRAAGQGVYFERELPASPDEVRAVYSRILAVEAASWKGINDCGMTCPPADRFYGNMLQKLSAANKARVIFARHEARDIGFIFGGMAGDVYRGQQFSYAEAWRDSSIGNLLQMAQIAWLCEEGAKRYDMGPLNGPRMDYKAHWAELEFTMIQTCFMFKK